MIFSKSLIDKNIINNKGDRLGLRGIEEQFCLDNLPNSRFPIYWNYKNAKKSDHDYKKLIGYNFKEHPVRNWNNLDLTQEETDGLIAYYEANSDKKVIKNNNFMDITLLTTKTASWARRPRAGQRRDHRQINYNTGPKLKQYG